MKNFKARAIGLKAVPQKISSYLTPFKNHGRKLKKKFSDFLAAVKKRAPSFRSNSVRFEISVIYTVILGIILLSFSSFFYFITSRTLYDELDNELKFKAQSITDTIQTYLQVRGEQPQTLQFAVEKTIAHEGETLRRWWDIGFERSWFRRVEKQNLSEEDYINFVSIDRSWRIKSKNLRDHILENFMKDEQLEQDKEKYWDINAGGNGMRVINYPYPPDAVPTHVIQVGISKGPVILLLKKWMVSVLISIPFILVVTWFVGRLLASRILRPLNRITATAGKISYENLNLRVEPKLNYLEMNRLIGTFNDMISRLEKSFEHIENFSTHVAHELKTPLTIIRGEAELAFIGAKSIQHKNSMSIIIDEIDTVLRTIEDLLFLSKTNYQPDSFNFQEIDLGKLLNETGEKFELITNEKNIRFQFSRPKEMIFIRADKLHLRRLFFNLLDNALKFTPERGTMKIEILIAEKDVHICISDSGIGISQDDLARVFDQFFHGDNKQKGTGLGLSIAQAIAKAHNGKITVESQLSVGTTFTVILPFIRVFKPALV